MLNVLQCTGQSLSTENDAARMPALFVPRNGLRLEVGSAVLSADFSYARHPVWN